MQIKILYEDENILAIDKPAGISVNPVPDFPEENVLEILKKKYSNIELAHRLDKETSGVLLLAKNENALEFLKKQFAGRSIKKTYVAIVSGYLKKDFGVIDKPIGRSKSDPRKRLAGRGVTGKEREAVTEYRVLKRFEDSGQKFTYVEIHPKTGRTHQIRVHFKYLNFPVVGDALYNPDGSAPAGLGRMALHAKSIEFKNLNGEVLNIESTIPREFSEVIQ